ncbi:MULTISPECIES: GTPase HflX [unclassified Imperialibacter]|uniref:GTPase HflX n=1 Tax=unclassified Imperialibacter TaxID=2629706 RepID=UPI0012536E6B|nr:MULTISPECIES: GTPase HflX [unclassified Imperialibacter]CAD5274420.1 GTPase HflX [Imperialibacter sp. 75]CAD5288087.1 GTPase HflX [Imperialibacter sp. 89]VVT35585.1 GTPase HflX [Imperialibacter sp. EC-SDR9]
MDKLISTAPVPLKAVLVALINKDQPPSKAEEFLDELEFLAQTLGLEIEGKFSQRLPKPDTRSFVGKGKLEEINTFVKAEEIDVVIFDDDLTPSQLRNLENELKVKIYDRSLLILDIFLERAQTSQARTQVELARYEYLLPRLTRMWTHLERQRGGTGTRGGAGEKEIETDRRAIRDQITVLKKRLEKIEKQGITQRKARGQMVRVSLVGYTNVGKSTIMNRLSKSDVLAENKLFATVDSTVRKVVINDIPFLLSDTVGFIRKLPHALIESFKSTLDEVREADILLHVVDISHPSFEEHAKVVEATLKEIGADAKPVITIFNKIDLIPEKVHEETADEFEIQEPEKPTPRERAMALYTEKPDTKLIFISATSKGDISKLRETLYKEVLEHHISIYPNYLKNVNY